MAQSSGGGGGSSGGPQPSESMTDVTYHIDDEDAPYRTKIPKPSESVTLADFKAVLPARLH